MHAENTISPPWKQTNRITGPPAKTTATRYENEFSIRNFPGIPPQRSLFPAEFPVNVMHIQSLYLDTSVIGGYHDTEWLADTRELWQQAQAGQWRLVTSIVAEAELKNAPANVRDLFAATFDASNILDTSTEIEDLAQAYLAAGVVPPKFADDALHVAMATVHGVRLVVSWNFKHLVNVRREDGFNAVNLLQGWPAVRIVSPKEIIHAHDKQPE